MKAMTKMTGGKRNKERIDAWDIYTRYSDEEIVELIENVCLYQKGIKLEEMIIKRLQALVKVYKQIENKRNKVK